jgi:uncharacterized membrane protein YeaQ/YmgE (transglycosylase-associated protein family)
MFFGILGWLAVGLIIGFVATKFVNLRGDDPRLSIAAAAVGAIIAGVLYSVISGDGVSAWNLWSIVCAAAGAAAGAVAWHAVRSRYISHDSYTVRRSY